MPTKGSRVPVLVDTSVAVAMLVEDHENHSATVLAVDNRDVGLVGHAAFETFSVITRLPAPIRRSPQVVSRLLASNFPNVRFLSADGARELFLQLPSLGISGGSVYDALVGWTAIECNSTLLTRDARAIPVYRVLNVEIELVEA
jgi:predicted nucleic acid-binding protein